MHSIARSTDQKLISVAVVFVMLKACALVVNIRGFYFPLSMMDNETSAPTPRDEVLLFISVRFAHLCVLYVCVVCCVYGVLCVWCVKISFVCVCVCVVCCVCMPFLVLCVNV